MLLSFVNTDNNEKHVHHHLNGNLMMLTHHEKQLLKNIVHSLLMLSGSKMSDKTSALTAVDHSAVKRLLTKSDRRKVSAGVETNDRSFHLDGVDIGFVSFSRSCTVPNVANASTSSK